MIKGKKCVAIIPARSGSKSIKDKNIKLLNNKPLMAYTIEFSLSSDFIDYTLLSTDSEEYAEIGKKFGAKVPFIRPKELAQDNSTGISVILHSLQWITQNIKDVGYIFFLQPTTPFRSLEDINNIVEMSNTKGADVIVSVCEAEHPPQWMYKLGKDSKLGSALVVDGSSKRRQDLEKYYRLNGAYYFSEINFLIKNKSFYSDNTYAYVMPTIRSIDIDTELDFLFAEFLLKQNLI